MGFIIAGLLPLALLAFTGLIYRKERHALVAWRRVLFLIGVAGTAISTMVLITFMTHAYVASHGTTPKDLDREYPVLSMMTLALLAAALGCCGRRASRLMLISGGLVTTACWYIVALAVSP